MNGASPTDGRSSGARAVGIAVRTAGSLIGLKAALAVLAALLCLFAFIGLFITASSSAVGKSGQVCGLSGQAGSGIPPEYVPWLAKAATRYKLGPRGASIVAAVHYVESDYGRSKLPGVAPGTHNYMGAMGPGQFLEASWPPFGVDGDGDGDKDPYSIPDSVFATANLLRASGAPGDWHGAIFAYNHAEWYVEKVLAKAATLDLEVACTATNAALGPLPADRLARLEYVARWIGSRRLPYCWGGGHAPKPGPSGGSYCWSAAGEQVFGSREQGLDCSGAVRWLLVLSGYPDPGPLVPVSSGLSTPPEPAGR